ncbi:MAG: FGGY family carbohydrate kinase, partial [Acidimicrobiales bacterium]
MSILVIDVGTSGVRSAVVNTDGTLRFDVRQANLPDSPMPGLVEFDATILWEAVQATALAALAQADDVSAIG